MSEKLPSAQAGPRDRVTHLGRLDGRIGMARHDLERQESTTSVDMLHPLRHLRRKVRNTYLRLFLGLEADTILESALPYDSEDSHSSPR